MHSHLLIILTNIDHQTVLKNHSQILITKLYFLISETS
jgi:uncharacterized protein (DUF302 family)